MIKLKDILNEAMSDAEIKKMHQKYKDTGELPPHLKKMLKGKKDFEKKFKVKNIVVPGLEWMSKIKEASVNEGPTSNDLMKELEKVNEITIKILKKYEKSIGNYMPAVIQKWMMGLHSDIKKQGYRV